MTQKHLLNMYMDLLDLQVGDTVKVTHKVPSFYLGVGYIWNDRMEECIGKTFTVEHIDVEFVRLEEDERWMWHPACLEVVKRKPLGTTITFGTQEDGINPEFVAAINGETATISTNGGNELVKLDFNTVELIFKHMNKLSGKMLLTQGEE